MVAFIIPTGMYVYSESKHCGEGTARVNGLCWADRVAQESQKMKSSRFSLECSATRVGCSGREASELPSLWIEPGIPEVKRQLLARKRFLETWLGFSGYTPSVSSCIERDDARCFSRFICQVRCFRGHFSPPYEQEHGQSSASNKPNLAVRYVSPLAPTIGLTANAQVRFAVSAADEM